MLEWRELTNNEVCGSPDPLCFMVLACLTLQGPRQLWSPRL